MTIQITEASCFAAFGKQLYIPYHCSLNAQTKPVSPQSQKQTCAPKLKHWSGMCRQFPDAGERGKGCTEQLSAICSQFAFG